MPAYTRNGPFTNGGAPGIDATFLNAVEDNLVGAPYGLTMLSTPYMLASNATINNGNTNTYTCTGGSTGVPTGATAVLLNAFFTPSAAGTSARFSPHGTAWAAGQYPICGDSANATNINTQNFVCPLDSGGQIDVKASGGNVVGIYLGIAGYIY